MLEIGLTKKDKELTDKVLEEYKALNGATIIDGGQFMQIRGQYNNTTLIHWFSINNSTLYTGPILIAPKKDQELMAKVMRINENIAKYANCKIIATQASHVKGEEREMFEKSGYHLINGYLKRKVE